MGVITRAGTRGVFAATHQRERVKEGRMPPRADESVDSSSSLGFPNKTHHSQAQVASDGWTMPASSCETHACVMASGDEEFPYNANQYSCRVKDKRGIEGRKERVGTGPRARASDPGDSYVLYTIVCHLFKVDDQ